MLELFSLQATAVDRCVCIVWIPNLKFKSWTDSNGTYACLMIYLLIDVNWIYDVVYLSTGVIEGIVKYQWYHDHM